MGGTVTTIKQTISSRFVSTKDENFEARLNQEIIGTIVETRRHFNERHGDMLDIAANYTVQAADEYLRVDATNGAVTITLPDPLGFHRRLTVKKLDSSANAVTLSSRSLIDGATTQALRAKGHVITVVSNGVSWDRVVVPVDQASIWEKGSNVASAATVTLGEGTLFHITGTTTITDIDFATPEDGRIAFIIFDGALTLTHNATTLALPGNANITTAAGDRACFAQDSGDNMICLWYERKALGPIKETWSPSTRSTGDTLGDHPSHSTTVSHRTEVYIPSDFTLLVSVQLVGASVGGFAAANFTISSDYGAKGEAYNQHSESSTVSKAFVANEITYLSLATATTALAAGDHLGVLVAHDDGQAVHWLGVLLRYQ